MSWNNLSSWNSLTGAVAATISAVSSSRGADIATANDTLTITVNASFGVTDVTVNGEVCTSVARPTSTSVTCICPLGFGAVYETSGDVVVNNGVDSAGYSVTLSVPSTMIETDFTVAYASLGAECPFAGDTDFSAIVIGDSCIRDIITAPDSHFIRMTGDGVFALFTDGTFTTPATVTRTQTYNYYIWDASDNTQSASIGIVTGTFVATPDTTPDPFTFNNQTDVALSSEITSDPITITGINAPSAINISIGTYDINGSGNFVSTEGLVNNGDLIRVRHTSAAFNGSNTVSILTVGGVSNAFISIVIDLDTTIPVITLVGSSPVSVVENTIYTDAGATASDNIDGNITSSIEILNPVDIETIGQYTVTYNVTDAEGNSATEVTRTVNVIALADVIIPVISLLGSTPIDVTEGTSYSDAGATATDNIDGDITGNIVTVNPVNINIVGAYNVTYNVDDAAGNSAAQVTRVVNVVADIILPVITATGDLTINHTVDTVYTDQGATWTDNVDGGPFAVTDINGTVNTAVIGTYTIAYNALDAAGNRATEVVRTVNVVAESTGTSPLVVTNITTVADNISGSLPYDGGNLAVDTVSAITHISNGLNYTANQRLCVSIDTAKAYVAGGLPFTSAGRMAMTTDAVIYYSNGWPFAANGRIAVTLV